MNTTLKTQVALPPTGDQARSERSVPTVASTDPQEFLAMIAQRRAADARWQRWKRGSLAVLVLGMAVGALTIPRLRRHSLAAARVEEAGHPASRAAGATLPVIEKVAPKADDGTSAAPALTTAQDPAARCESDFTQHQWKLAMDSCAAAFDAMPSPALAMRNAHAHWARGDAGGAGSWGRRALELGTKDADAYVLLGNSERAAGNDGAAVAAYRRYLELAPRGWHAGRLRAVIRVLNAESASKKPSMR